MSSITDFNRYHKEHAGIYISYAVLLVTVYMLPVNSNVLLLRSIYFPAKRNIFHCRLQKYCNIQNHQRNRYRHYSVLSLSYCRYKNIDKWNEKNCNHWNYSAYKYTIQQIQSWHIIAKDLFFLLHLGYRFSKIAISVKIHYIFPATIFKHLYIFILIFLSFFIII